MDGWSQYKLDVLKQHTGSRGNFLLGQILCVSIEEQTVAEGY